jgi:quercetin dioxygenase-like cupin family protein
MHGCFSGIANHWFKKNKKMEHFIALDKLERMEALKGAFLSIVQTENLTVAYTDMAAGAEIPLHHHPEEAVDIMLEGVLEIQIGDKTDTLTPGMISVVKSNLPHRAVAVTACKVVTIFYPKRQMQG